MTRKLSLATTALLMAGCGLTDDDGGDGDDVLPLEGCQYNSDCPGEGDTCDVELHQCIAADVNLQDANYFMSCILYVLGADQEITFRPRFAVRIDPDVAGTPAELTIRFQPLLAEATTVGDVVGPVFPAGGASGAVADGVALLDVGDTPTLPPEADGLTSKEWGFTSFVVHVETAGFPGDLCASVEGATAPSGLVLSTDKDYCLLAAVDSPDDVVQIPADDAYQCP